MFSHFKLIEGMFRFISERIRAAVKAAKQRRVKFGHKPELTKEQLDKTRKMIDVGKHSRQPIAALFNAVLKTFTGPLPVELRQSGRRTQGVRQFLLYPNEIV